MFKKMIKKVKKAIEWYCNRAAMTYCCYPTGMLPYKVIEDENNDEK